MRNKPPEISEIAVLGTSVLKVKMLNKYFRMTSVKHLKMVSIKYFKVVKE